MFSFSKEPRALRDCTVRVQLAWALGWVAEVASCGRRPAPAVGMTEPGPQASQVAPATLSRTVSSVLLQQAQGHVADLHREVLTLEGTTSLEAQKPRRGFPEARDLSLLTALPIGEMGGVGCLLQIGTYSPASFAAYVCV